LCQEKKSGTLVVCRNVAKQDTAIHDPTKQTAVFVEARGIPPKMRQSLHKINRMNLSRSRRPSLDHEPESVLNFDSFSPEFENGKIFTFFFLV
jgi:hypothetical protein